MNQCIWITGLPGSGKSTIAGELEKLFSAAGLTWIRLSLDELRKFLTPTPRYTDDEREVVYRSLVLTADLLMAHSNKHVIIDATANRRVFRDLAREKIPHFIEVYVKCPIEVCQSRESKRDVQYVEQDLYKKARGGQLQGNLPGVSTPYEEPLNPEVVIPSDTLDPHAAAKKIMDAIASAIKG